MKNYALLSFTLAQICILGGCSSTKVEKLETESSMVKNLNQIDDIFLAGQPQPQYFAEAGNQGLATVICLREESEITGFDPREVVEAQGMTYINIPFQTPDELTDSVFDKVRQQLASAERPIMIYCGSANRVAAVWIPWRVLDEGLSWEDALSEAKSIGLRTPAYEIRARAYIDSVRRGFREAG